MRITPSAAALFGAVLLGLLASAASQYNPAHYSYEDVQYQFEEPDYHDTAASQYDYSSSAQPYGDDYSYDYDYGYSKPTRRGLRNRGYGHRHRNSYYDSQPVMARHAKSYAKPKPKKEFVPVVIKKKKQKKKKILTTHHGFFIRGGTAMFGKFKDLHSCQKACEITPTCFAGDFNPWLGKCFLHSNLTACASMSSHKAITHFKKVPCQVTETPRGVVVLGASTLLGIEIKGVDSLQDCIKKCVTAGGGIASADDTVADNPPQICCNIDYDFATHRCFQHPCINLAITNMFCVGTNIEAPLNSVSNPSVVTITFCPLADA